MKAQGSVVWICLNWVAHWCPDLESGENPVVAWKRPVSAGHRHPPSWDPGFPGISRKSVLWPCFVDTDTKVWKDEGPFPDLTARKWMQE